MGNSLAGKRLALICNSNNEHYNASFDYALIEVTPELCAIVAKRKAAFESISEGRFDLTETHYHDYRAIFFAREQLSDYEEGEGPIQEMLNCEIEMAELPESFAPSDVSPDGFDFRSEYDRMVVTNTGVRWECCPKHSSVLISTATLSWSDFGLEVKRG